MRIEHMIQSRSTGRGVAYAHNQRFATRRGGFCVPEARDGRVCRKRAQTRRICVINPPINGSETHGGAVVDSEAFILNIEANDGTERHIPVADRD